MNGKARRQLAVFWGVLLFSVQVTATIECPVPVAERLSDENLNYQNLTSWMEKHRSKLTSYVHAIACLPETLRASNTLMHTSHGAQAAKPDRPRVILFAPDGKFYLAFTGVGIPEDGLPETFGIEVTQFQDKAHGGLPRYRFDYHEILFRRNEDRDTYAFEYTHADNPNPDFCMGCHQSPERRNKDPRPNWEGYSNWPGAFGSDDDFLSLSLAIDRHYQNKPSFEEERDFLGKLTAFDHSEIKRLRALEDYEERKNLMEFFLNESKPDVYKHLAGLDQYQIVRNGRTLGTANIKLSFLTNYRNFHRVYRMMAETDTWKRDRYTVMKRLLGCGSAYYTPYNRTWVSYAKAKYDYFWDWSTSFLRKGVYSGPYGAMGILAGVIWENEPDFQVMKFKKTGSYNYGYPFHHPDRGDGRNITEYCRWLSEQN